MPAASRGYRPPRTCRRLGLQPLRLRSRLADHLGAFHGEQGHLPATVWALDPDVIPGAVAEQRPRQRAVLADPASARVRHLHVDDSECVNTHRIPNPYLAANPHNRRLAPSRPYE